MTSGTRPSTAAVGGTKFAMWRWTAPPGTGIVTVNGGRWHVFMTVKLPGRSAIEYCSFRKWEEADGSPRTILKVSHSDYYCAPQVFYFAPHNLWYLIYQWGARYSTNPDINNPNGWSAPQSLLCGEPSGSLDFWTICDDANCHLFFSRDDGVLYRMELRYDEDDFKPRTEFDVDDV